MTLKEIPPISSRAPKVSRGLQHRLQKVGLQEVATQAGPIRFEVESMEVRVSGSQGRMKVPKCSRAESNQPCFCLWLKSRYRDMCSCELSPIHSLLGHACVFACTKG